MESTPDSNLREFTKIVDTAHFAGKEDTSLLQIADAAAYVMARKLRGAQVDEQCFHSLISAMPKLPTQWKEAADKLDPEWCKGDLKFTPPPTCF